MPTQPAALGTARLNNFRLGYMSAALTAVRATRVRILLAGLDVRVRVAGLTIHDVLNDAPNTCSLTIDGSETPVGEQSLRITINSDTPRLLFAGALQTLDGSYEGKPTQKVYPCTAIDDTDQAKRRRPFGTWTSTSATTIAQYLATLEGMSTAGIAAALPAVSVNLDGTEGFAGAMDQLATLIGGYWKVEDRVVYLFQTDTTDAPDDIDSTPGRFLDRPPITVRTDVSQLRTRVFGKGHGEAILTPVAIGDTTIPVANAGPWFSATGGGAMAGTQRLTYTSREPGGTASTVLGNEIAAPPAMGAPADAAGGAMAVGTYWYQVTFATSQNETTSCPVFGAVVGVGKASVVFSAGTFWTSSDARVIARKVYRTVVGGASSGPFKLVTTVNDNTTTTFTDTLNDSGLGTAHPPTSNNTGEPTAAGSTTLRVADLAQFLATGGWVTVSSQTVRYTGRAAASGAGNLTGIPASGTGAIAAAIPAYVPILTTSFLTGIPASGGNSVQTAIPSGDTLNIWVQRDDLTAQATQAAIDAANGRLPADGVYEGPPIVDERRNEASLTSLCDATLAVFSTPIVTVTYATRDVKTKSGKTVHINLTTPPIGPIDLAIQEVTITEIDTAPGTAPRFTVLASSKRFRLEDLLRRMAV